MNKKWMASGSCMQDRQLCQSLGMVFMVISQLAMLRGYPGMPPPLPSNLVLAAHLVLPEHRQEHKTQGDGGQDRLDRREQKLDLQVRAQRSKCRDQ